MGSSWYVEETHPPADRVGDTAEEELARRIGYDNIVPDMPHTTARTFAINPLHELEQRSLQYFSNAHDFHEIHGYLWYNDSWIAQLGFDPGATPGLRLVQPRREELDGDERRAFDRFADTLLHYVG